MLRSRLCDGQRLCVVESLEQRRLFSAVIAISGTDTLLVFDSAKPEKTLAKVRVRGLARGEALLGIDFRPATGQLYGLGDSSRLYRIDPTTGQATAAGAVFAPPVSGNEFGVDFNPVTDQVRVVSDADYNARLDPETGLVIDASAGVANTQNDLSVAYLPGDVAFGANPSIVASAHSRSMPGGLATTLYGIDADTNMLVRQGSIGGSLGTPDAGGLITIGALGLDVTAVAGLDITTLDQVDTAYAALATTGRSTLYTVSLTGGAATPIGEIGGSKTPVRDIAVVPKGQTILVLDNKNRIHSFDSNLPNVRLSQHRVSGLAKKEMLVALDVRPADGVVYGFSSHNRLYTLNPFNGAATAVGEPTAVAPAKSPAAMDFDPVTGHVRLVNAIGQNLRMNPVTGQVIDADTVLANIQIDGPLVFSSTDTNAAARPVVAGIAHSVDGAGAAATTLYAIDSKLDILTTIGSAGGSTSATVGQVFSVGHLGVKVRDAAPMDVVSTGGVDRAYAVFRERSAFALYQIDLSSGLATTHGLLALGLTPVGLTVLPTA